MYINIYIPIYVPYSIEDNEDKHNTWFISVHRFLACPLSPSALKLPHIAARYCTAYSVDFCTKCSGGRFLPQSGLGGWLTGSTRWRHKCQLTHIGALDSNLFNAVFPPRVCGIAILWQPKLTTLKFLGDNKRAGLCSSMENLQSPSLVWWIFKCKAASRIAC